MKSIRSYLMIAVSIVLVTTFVTAMAISYFEARHEVDELFDAELAQTARLLKFSYLKVGGLESPTVGDSRTKPHSPDLLPDIDSDLERTLYGHRYERKVMFQVRQGGRVLFESEHASFALNSAPEVGFSEVVVDGQLWYLFTLKEGGLSFTAGEKADIRDELAEEILSSYMIPLVVCLPLVLVLTLWVLTRGLKPLQELANNIGKRGENNLAPIIMEDTPEEIRPVLSALNHLFDQVHNSIEMERRFTAMASHEMRTPISVLKVNAQNALKATSEEERQLYLNDLDKGVDRASRLMEQLLTLSKLEQTELAYERQIIDLLPLVREEIAAMYPLAAGRGVQVSLDCGLDTAELKLVPQLVPVVVRNLIENAIKYAPDGGEVKVTIVRAPTHLHLIIEDNGIGVPEPERENIFNRFYRLPNAAVQGSGLGLAIVRRILDILEANITLTESTVLGGLMVDISFPQSEQ